MKILSTLYFEKIFPEEYHKMLRCIQASQSRMSLCEVLKLPMGLSWLRASDHYLGHLRLMVNFCRNYPHMKLQQHPNFEWSVNDKYHLTSSCWLADMAMCHMIHGLASQEEAKKCEGPKESNKYFKDAEKDFEDMNRVLVQWKRMGPCKHIPFLNPSWSSAKNLYCKAQQSLTGFQYAIKNDKHKGALACTKKMEQYAALAIQEWSSPEAYELLNVARCCRAAATAIEMHPEDRGKAIGMMNRWAPLFEEVDKEKYPVIQEYLEKSKAQHINWVNENNQIYFESVPEDVVLKSVHKLN